MRGDDCTCRLCSLTRTVAVRVTKVRLEPNSALLRVEAVIAMGRLTRELTSGAPCASLALTQRAVAS